MAETQSLITSLRDIAESMSAGAMWHSKHRKRLRDAADRLTTLTRENERLREALKSLSVRYDAEGACVWFCECCNAESDTHGDIQHAPDCLAYGGKR